MVDLFDLMSNAINKCLTLFPVSFTLSGADFDRNECRFANGMSVDLGRNTQVGFWGI
jgi:hypothetical protein